MNLKLTEEEIGALWRLLRNAPTGLTYGITNPLYISPAQQLRNQADRIEREAADYPILQRVLAKIETIKQ